MDDIHYAYNCGSGIADQGGLSVAVRDNAGNPLTWGDTADLYGRVYNYDKNGRLDDVNYPGIGLVNFTYDWVGNRTSLSGRVYNAADQLTAMTGHTYLYDGAGNMVYDNSTSYAYTPSNLLSTAGDSSMIWDAAGNRIRFTSSTDQSNPYIFVYDPTAGTPAVIEEVHNSASVYYIREPSGALIARVSGEVTQYYLFDDLGSTLLMTGADGTVTDKYTYDAWGDSTSHTGSTNQPYQYVGQSGYYTHHQDVNLPLIQLGVRFYDPEIGRFTQTDPEESVEAAYEYVVSSPTDYVDPSGERRKRLSNRQWRIVHCHLKALAECLPPGRSCYQNWGYEQLRKDVRKWQHAKDKYYALPATGNMGETMAPKWWGYWTGMNLNAMYITAGYNEELATTILHEFMHFHDSYWNDYYEAGLANTARWNLDVYKKHRNDALRLEIGHNHLAGVFLEASGACVKNRVEKCLKRP